MAAATRDARNALLIEELLGWEQATHDVLPEGQRMEALEHLLKVALDLCGADSGSLMVVDESGRELRVIVSRGLKVKPEQAPRIKMGDRIAGRIAEQGTPVLLRNEGADPKMASLFSRRDEIRTAACVPCRTVGAVTGVLTVNQCWNGKEEMDESDLGRLQVLANYAAPGLDRLTAVSPESGTAETRWIADPRAQARIDRLANLGVVAGGIAHEISNPLQGAIGLVEVILQQHDTQSAEDRRRDLVALREDLYRLADTVSGLLSFVRESKSGPALTMNVADCVESAVRSALTQSATSRIRCERSYEMEVPPVEIHPAHLRQILLNLTINATQAMGKEGELRLGFSPSADGRCVEIVVGDTGPGISPENQERIFEPGFTTKQDANGTGLGLAVSRNLARESGGDLTARSQPGGGATFTVTVPVAEL